MVQSDENIQKIKEAKNNGYQIVCRQLSGMLDSWYITNTTPPQWNWHFNEYRVYVGCEEPPMLNQMNEYSVYYCGYSYYFLENNGELRKQININVAQDYDTTPYFKSNQIFTDKISKLEQDKIEITDNTEIDKNLTVDGDINLKNGLTVSGNTTVEDLTVNKNGTVSENLTVGKNETVSGNLTVDGDINLKNGLTVSGDTTVENLTVNKNGMVTGTLTVENLNIGTKALIDMIYPIGSLYWSSKNINPNSLFGGTWEQIKDKFVLAAGDTYSSGTTGGSASVNLTTANLPSHNHTFTPKGSVSSHSHTLNSGNTSSSGTTATAGVRNEAHSHSYTLRGYESNVWVFDGSFMSKSSNNYVNSGSSTSTSSTTTQSYIYGKTDATTPTFTGSSGTTSSVGSGTAFSILPPYIVKYCWERIA